MKCPECDLEQPDNTVTCSKCGLDFKAWREANPDPPPGLSPEAQKAKGEASAQGGPSPSLPPGADLDPEAYEGIDTAPPEKPSDPTEETAKEEAPPAEKAQEQVKGETTPDSPADKKDFKWKPIYTIGIGLVAILAIGVGYFTNRTPGHTTGPESVTPTPLAAGAPLPSLTPGSSTPSPSPTYTASPVPPTPTHVLQAAPPAKKIHPPSPTPSATPTPEEIAVEEEAPTDSPTESEPSSPVPSPTETPMDILEMPQPKASATPTP